MPAEEKKNEEQVKTVVKAKAVAPDGAVKVVKTTVKKQAAKGEKKASAKALSRAPVGREFHLMDGRNIADLKELADIFDDMSISVWNHHVRHDSNDFANWIHDVFDEPELAQHIRESPTSHHAQVVIYRTILERS